MLGACRRKTREAVEARAVHLLRISDRALHAVSKFAFAPGSRAQCRVRPSRNRPPAGYAAPLARRRLARGAISLRRPLIGELVFDVTKAGARRRLEALEKVELGKQGGKIGREPGHALYSIPRAQVLDFFRCKPIIQKGERMGAIFQPLGARSPPVWSFSLSCSSSSPPSQAAALRSGSIAGGNSRCAGFTSPQA